MGRSVTNRATLSSSEEKQNKTCVLSQEWRWRGQKTCSIKTNMAAAYLVKPNSAEEARFHCIRHHILIIDKVDRMILYFYSFKIQ